MLKRVFSFFLFLVIFTLSIGQAWADAWEVFDLTKVEQGIVGINYPSHNKTKVMIQKDGITYYYDVNSNIDTFPLQLGSGSYQLALLENIEGNKYAVKRSMSTQVNLKDDKISFLQSASPVYWHKDSDTAKLAAKLTENLDTDEKKAYAIYDFIVKNIKYDKNKTSGLETDYIPVVDEILLLGRGICYDYAALYAAMLRSLGIPAKLVKGYKNDIEAYHAWNEVYLEEHGWVTIDTTYDDVMLENGTSPSFYKNINEYTKVREY